MEAGAQKSGGAAALPAPPPPRSLQLPRTRYEPVVRERWGRVYHLSCGILRREDHTRHKLLVDASLVNPVEFIVFFHRSFTQIQVHRRYSILEKTCSCNRIKLNYQATKKKIESTRKHRRLGSKFCDRLPTTMTRARKQRKYINRHINIIKIRGKKTRHLPYIKCPLILPTKHVASQTDFVVLVSLYCAEPLSNLNLKHNF